MEFFFLPHLCRVFVPPASSVRATIWNWQFLSAAGIPIV